MSTTERTSPVAIGDVVDGKYRVDRLIGAGGMGVVVAATHLQLEQVMALKLMHAEAARHAHLVQRFLREARAACRLKGEHVARVTDVGTAQGGIPFFVMEYLEGMDLGAMCKTKGPLPVIEAVTYVLQAAEAITEAHSLGIVHRDIKPANLFVTRRPNGSPSVKVLDFGISKLDERSNPSAPDDMTSTGAILGSVHYMPPEQLRSARDADTRSDVWALGAVLYRLLAGRPPFVADSVTEVGAMILRDTATPLRMLRPDVPASLEAVVQQCLAKAPEERFQSAQELGLALAAVMVAVAPSSTGSYGGFVPELFASAIPPSRTSGPGSISQPDLLALRGASESATDSPTDDMSEAATVGVVPPDGVPAGSGRPPFGSGPTLPTAGTLATASIPGAAPRIITLSGGLGSEQNFHTGASWGLTQVGVRRRNRLMLSLVAVVAGIVVALIGAVVLVVRSEPPAAATGGDTAANGDSGVAPGAGESASDAGAVEPATTSSQTDGEPAPNEADGGSDEATTATSATATAKGTARPVRTGGSRPNPKPKGTGTGPRDFGGRR